MRFSLLQIVQFSSNLRSIRSCVTKYVETSIHLLKISHPSAGRTQRQDDLFRGLYLPTKPFFTNRTAAHGRASSQVNEVNNCTQLYNRAKNTHARGHMHPTINQSMFTYVSIYHYSSDIYSSKFSKTEHSSTPACNGRIIDHGHNETMGLLGI